jgi:hypothetical protein
MQREIDGIRSKGGQVVAIGQGKGDYAAGVCAEFGIGFPCLGDPARTAYRDFALGRASLWSITAGSFLTDPITGLRRLRNASLRRSLHPRSDVLQLGGVAVVDRTGQLRFLHRATSPDDFPPLRELLAALEGTARRA